MLNNHLKSHFVRFDQDPVSGAQEANDTRQRQAETAAQIIDRQTRKGSAYVVCGDMNDPAPQPLPGAWFRIPSWGWSTP